MTLGWVRPRVLFPSAPHSALTTTLASRPDPQIHTHPTQSIFLSSLDLHTHLGLQLLLREAIAVVCAPSASDDEPQCGVFRMTDPPGMGAVAACREGGAFHPQ